MTCVIMFLTNAIRPILLDACSKYSRHTKTIHIAPTKFSTRGLAHASQGTSSMHQMDHTSIVITALCSKISI